MTLRSLRVVFRDLKARKKSIRAEAVNELGSRGPKAVRHAPRLIALLSDPDPHIRTVTARALRQLGADSARVQAALRAAISTKHPIARAEIAATLYCISGNTYGPLEVLTQLIYTGDPEVIESVVGILRDLNAQEQAVELLKNALSRPEPQGPVLAFSLIGRPAAVATETLLGLNHVSPDMSGLIEAAVARIAPNSQAVRGEPPDLPDRTNRTVRFWALAAVCFAKLHTDKVVRIITWAFKQMARDLGPQSSVLAPVLARGLKANVPAHRAWYANLIGELGKYGLPSDGVGPALIGATVDESPEVRFGAAYALSRVKPIFTPGVRALAALLKDPDRRVRQEAAFSLRDAEEAAAVALPDLVETAYSNSDSCSLQFDTSDSYLRKTARGTLDSLIGISVPRSLILSMILASKPKRRAARVRSKYDIDASGRRSPDESPCDSVEPSPTQRPNMRLAELIKTTPDCLKWFQSFYALGRTRENGRCSHERAACALGGVNKSLTSRHVREFETALSLGSVKFGPLVTRTHKGSFFTDVGDMAWQLLRDLFEFLRRLLAQSQ